MPFSRSHPWRMDRPIPGADSPAEPAPQGVVPLPPSLHNLLSPIHLAVLEHAYRLALAELEAREAVRRRRRNAPFSLN